MFIGRKSDGWSRINSTWERVAFVGLNVACVFLSTARVSADGHLNSVQGQQRCWHGVRSSYPIVTSTWTCWTDGSSVYWPNTSQCPSVSTICPVLTCCLVGPLLTTVPGLPSMTLYPYLVTAVSRLQRNNNLTTLVNCPANERFCMNGVEKVGRVRDKVPCFVFLFEFKRRWGRQVELGKKLRLV